MRDPEVVEPGVRVPPPADEVGWGKAVGIGGAGPAKKAARRRNPVEENVICKRTQLRQWSIRG